MVVNKNQLKYFKYSQNMNFNIPYYFRWGKRALEDNLMRPVRATPLRWGKRSTDSQLFELYNKRAPLRWGKRAPSRYVCHIYNYFFILTNLVN